LYERRFRSVNSLSEAIQLADLRPESEVILKLATDQKGATRITVQGE
jgi:hypothetical protein